MCLCHGDGVVVVIVGLVGGCEEERVDMGEILSGFVVRILLLIHCVGS